MWQVKVQADRARCAMPGPGAGAEVGGTPSPGHTPGASVLPWGRAWAERAAARGYAAVASLFQALPPRAERRPGCLRTPVVAGRELGAGRGGASKGSAATQVRGEPAPVRAGTAPPPPGGERDEGRGCPVPAQGPGHPRSGDVGAGGGEAVNQ